MSDWRCSFGSGLSRCWQPRSATGDYGHPEWCFWHAKKAAGLMACSAKGCAKPEGHRPPCSPRPEERRTTTPDAQLSDEVREIEAFLRREDASVGTDRST